MTTIAFDGKTMAADRQVSTFRGSVAKIHRLADGSLYGASGKFDETVAVLAWLAGGEKPKIEEHIHAIVVAPSGKFHTYEKLLVALPAASSFMAVGSGRDFAMAAMHLGKSAAEAVKIAHLFDTDTGPDVDTLEVL